MSSALTDPLRPIEDKLPELEALGWSTPALSADLLANKAYYNSQRAQIESQYPSKIVAAANQTLIIGDDLVSVETAAIAANPTGAFYLEVVPPRTLELNPVDAI